MRIFQTRSLLGNQIACRRGGKAFSHALGHEGQFASPRLSGRSAFSEKTFAGSCGNEKDAPIPDLPAFAPERGGSTLSGPSRPRRWMGGR